MCLSGLTEAWNTIPENFFSRIVSIEIPKLSIDESLNLMTTYLSSSDEFNPYKSEKDIYPYTKASVSEILRLSDGNIRQFLNLAYEAFEEAAPHQERIRVETIKKVAQANNIYFDRQTVLKEIKNLLQIANFQFVENTKLSGVITGDLAVDLAIENEHNPIFLIQILDYIFLKDIIQNKNIFKIYKSILKKNFQKAKYM